MLLYRVLFGKLTSEDLTILPIKKEISFSFTGFIHPVSPFLSNIIITSSPGVITTPVSQPIQYPALAHVTSWSKIMSCREISRTFDFAQYHCQNVQYHNISSIVTISQYCSFYYSSLISTPTEIDNKALSR